MSSEASNLLEVAIGSAEASISVLLVLGFGYYAQYAGWVNDQGEKQISHLCVTVFLPALLFTQIGPHATPHNLIDYGIIVLLSIFAMVVSYLAGIASRRSPLLLLDSLEKTGTIGIIIGKGGGSVPDAVARGRTYLLIAALVGNVGRFALGPDIMGPKNNDHSDFPATYPPHPTCSNGRDHPSVVDCTAIAIVFGLISPLRHAFFSKGEPLNATITQSVNYLGKLYTALQMFVLGSKLRSKSGDKLPILSTSVLFIHRFIIMPAIMISIVYFLRSTWPSYVERDPMLDFVLSIVGIGPPAITLSAISEMAELESREDAQVSRLLMLSYIVTPFICVPISASVYVIGLLGLANN
ncbi:Auxin Efflux Carrier superfamily [Rhizoctonia solani]|uniref:Auxin Efflux Carrier superfamily n=1 Tax=Rhizoctonia solani TaxID=456999 RepID=A0A8H7M4A5_9AGAM|nr:Auxin Efflux Carrier superfamily [Rhizoctonia solani]